MQLMLSGEKVTKHFGGLAALNDVDFQLKKGEIVGLIGPNGAGKTTLFNCISGVYRPTSGTIKFMEKNITRLKPHDICRLGIGRTFQLVRLFPDLTVLDNAIVAAIHTQPVGLPEARARAMKYLEFTSLDSKKDVLTSSLTLLDRKFVEVARALAIEPKVILLDEIIAGLNPTETLQAMSLIKKIRDDLGVTVFWIEHIMSAVMGLAERIVVIHHGEKIGEGTPQEVANDEKVIDAYLGEKYVF